MADLWKLAFKNESIMVWRVGSSLALHHLTNGKNLDMSEPKFVRLLNLMAAIRGLSPFDRLTAEESRLLDDLILRWHRNRHLAVSDVMADGSHGSQSTAYRRIMALKEKGIISLRVDRHDKRLKFIDPTDMAQDYIRRLDDAASALGDEA